MACTPKTLFDYCRLAGCSLLAICALSVAMPTLAASEIETEEVSAEVGGDEEMTTPPGEPDDVSDDVEETEEGQCATYLPAELSERPQELVLQGVTCFESGHYEWALIYYQRAYDLTGERFLYGGMGRSLHELGLYGPARAYYKQFLRGEDVPSGTDRIRQRMQELEELVEDDGAIIALRSDPSGANVSIKLDNGEQYLLGSTPMDLSLRQGSYDFVFAHPGYHPREVAVTTDDEVSQIDGRLISETSSLSISERRRRRGGLVLTGLGAGAVATGGTMLGLSVHHDRRARDLEEGDFGTPSDYDERLRGHLDSSDQWRSTGLITAGAGSAVLLTGVILYVSGRPSSVENPPTDEENAQRGWTPTIGPGQVGVELRF